MNATITTNTAGNIEINGVAYEPAELSALASAVMGTGSLEPIGPDGAVTARDAVRGSDVEIRIALDRNTDTWIVTNENGRVGVLMDANGWCVAWLTLEGVTEWDVQVGQWVTAGEGDDLEAGQVTAVRGDLATVAWHQGTSTTTEIEGLTIHPSRGAALEAMGVAL